jgi:hypothetical protein
MRRKMTKKVTPEDEIAVFGKGILEGARTLSEAAQKIREYADYLESLEEEGYEFYQPVEDDYGFATPGGVLPDWGEDEKEDWEDEEDLEDLDDQ